MDIETFIDQISDEFTETDRSQLNPNTKFREIDEWTSLLNLSLSVMINDNYYVVLSGRELREVNTIQELFDKVKEKVESK